LANPKKQDSEIRLISFLFLNFTNKYAGTGLKVRQKAQKTQPTGHKKGEKGPFEGPTLHIKASDHEREKKARLKAQHSTVVPSDHLPHPLAASRVPRPVRLPLSPAHGARRHQFLFLSLAATSACCCRLFLSLSRTRLPPPAPSVRRRPTARGCSSLTSDLCPPKGPPTPIGEAEGVRFAISRA